MYFAIGVEPTNEIARTFGCVSNASTHSRPPCTMLNTPFGMPACSSSCAMRIAVSGTFSLGFSTNVFPQTSATGYIQSGTIAGKVERRDADADAERLADRLAIDAARDVLDRLAHEQRRNPAGELHHLDPAPHIAARFHQRLAMLARVELGTSSSKFSSSSILKRKKTRARSTGGVSHQRRISRRRSFDRCVHMLRAARRRFRDDFAASTDCAPESPARRRSPAIRRR